MNGHTKTIYAAIDVLESVRTAPVPPSVATAFITWAQRGPLEAKAAHHVIRVTSEEGVDAHLAILRQALPYAAADALFDDAVELQLARVVLGEVTPDAS
jgi:hypothetical protein